MSDPQRDHPLYAEGGDTERDASMARRTVVLEPEGTVLRTTELELAIVRGEPAGARLAIGATRVRLGTDPASDLALRDPSISRRHAEIVPTELGPLVVDLGSRNGTFVEGRRIERAYLEAGATLRLGTTELRVDARARTLTARASDAPTLPGFACASEPMRRVLALTLRLAPMPATVLVEGESGTGKEQIARALHSLSPRAAAPFVVLDASSLSTTLADAEIFGHEKGAFTGATEARAGAFERADGGTLFIDEIGELPSALQPKLLRVLERREIKRIGGSDVRTVDVRVVAATHRDLAAEVRAGRFREDLFHRLAVIRIALPPLRDRPEDIRAIARAMASSQEITSGRVDGITDAAIARLMTHRWPGNVRELGNVIRAAAAFASGERIDVLDLPRALAPHASFADTLREAEALDFKEARERVLSAFEADYLARVLRATRGNVSEAARRTGLHRKTIERMVRRHGLDLVVLGRTPRRTNEDADDDDDLEDDDAET